MYAPIVIRSSPGVKRDGTIFEGEHYIDAQWCRFYRGLPRKIGGYRAIDKYLPEIGRGIISYTQTALTHIHVGTANTLSYFYLDANGNPSVIYDRTPVDLQKNPSNQWQFDIIVDTSQVPPVNQLVAQVAPNIDCVCNAMGGQVFIGPLISTSPLVALSDLTPNFISSTGGVLSLNPYLFVFGSDGSIGWSAPGRPTQFNTYEATQYTSAFTTSAITAANSFSFKVPGDGSSTFLPNELVRLNGGLFTPSGLALALAVTATSTVLTFTGDFRDRLVAGVSLGVGTAGFVLATDVVYNGTQTVVQVSPAIGAAFPAGTAVELSVPTTAFLQIARAEFINDTPGYTQVSLTTSIPYGYPIGTTLTLETQTLTGAGSIRAASQKIVRGLPLRGGGGNSPAGIFWSADALLRCNFVGGDLVFSFDTISVNSSIISPASVIEQDGVYYWVGTDRFLMFNGVLRELPNNLNINWFFDNINRNYETKVFAFRIPRFGEIWWCFPFGDATECTHAIIYNIREQTWYDTVLPNGGRSAAEFSTVIARPLSSGIAQNNFFNSIGTIASVSLGGGVTAKARGDLTTIALPGTFITFRNNLTLGYLTVLDAAYDAPTDVTTITFTTSLPYTVQPDNYIYVFTTGFNFWQHEYGVDEYGPDYDRAILSYFETADISLTTQSPAKNKVLSVSMVEPDFVQSGDMQMQVTGSANARSVNEVSEPFTIYAKPKDANAQVVHFKTERRLMRFKFISNVLGGNYQMGQVLAHVAESDGRYLGGVK